MWIWKKDIVDGQEITRPTEWCYYMYSFSKHLSSTSFAFVSELYKTRWSHLLAKIAILSLSFCQFNLLVDGDLELCGKLNGQWERLSIQIVELKRYHTEQIKMRLFLVVEALIQFNGQFRLWNRKMTTERVVYVFICSSFWWNWEGKQKTEPEKWNIVSIGRKKKSSLQSDSFDSVVSMLCQWLVDCEVES